ncbi:MAG TPA: acyl--CoA ligase [Candidatus Dietzia intestinigallinarum]|nr:acyl--CoA ligase [Candidatus Dietzia intestinigallinarum]
MHLDPTGIDPVDHALARRCSVGDIPTRAAATFSSRTALTDETGSWTYRELESTANRVAHGLSELGVRAEEPVAILSTNCREFVAAYFGAAKAGMVALPVNLLSGPENIVHALVDSGTRVLVVHPDLAELALGATAAVPAIDHVVVIGTVPDGLEAAPDGPALLNWDDLLSSDDTNPDTVIADRQIVQCLYSSGTTSRPKGVLTSHLAVTMAGLSNGAIFGMGWGATGAITVLPLPLFHTAGLNGVLLAGITMGATIHLLAGFDPVRYADTVAGVRATHLVGLPLMLEALADGRDRGLDLSSIEMLLYAMAPMSAEMRTRLEAALPDAKIILGSGMSECTPATVMQWPELNPDKSDSWGYPAPVAENRICEPGGETLLEVDTDGELAYRGPTVMEGYWNNPEANAAVFLGGHMHSGDLGRIDPDGVVWFSDRVKDIVKSGGENVSSLHVERVLMDHPHLAEVACIGRPDDTWGEQVVVVVVATGDAPGEDELIESVLRFGAERLTPSQRPRHVVVTDTIPRTATGKIRKVELRSMN